MKKCEPQVFGRYMYILQADFEYLINILVQGAFLATITTYLGMSDSLTGIISAFASLGRLFQLLSVFFRRGSVKRFVLRLSLINQSLFVLLYLLPVYNRSAWNVALFVLSVLMSLFFYNVAHPKKTDWFMSMVPNESRGVFTANKEIISLISGIFFNFLMGALIDYYMGNGMPKTAFLIGAGTIFLFSVLHAFTLILTTDKVAVVSEKRTTPFYLFKNKTVIKIAVVALFWYVSTYSTISFYSTYQIKELGFSLTFISAITIASFVVRILFSRFWGVYADRNSFAKMACGCFAVAAFGHLVMTFTVPQNAKIFYVIYLVCYAVAQGGIGSALLNICYDYLPSSKCADALAFSEALGGGIGFLSTFLMSFLVRKIQNDGNSILGINIYAQQVLSVFALVIEIFAIIYIVKFVLSMPRVRGEK